MAVVMVRNQTLTCPDWVTLAFDYSAYCLIWDSDSNWVRIDRDSTVAASIDVAVAAAKRTMHSTKRDAYYVRAVRRPPQTFRVHVAVAVAASTPDAPNACADGVVVVRYDR